MVKPNLFGLDSDMAVGRNACHLCATNGQSTMMDASPLPLRFRTVFFSLKRDPKYHQILNRCTRFYSGDEFSHTKRMEPLMFIFCGINTAFLGSVCKDTEHTKRIHSNDKIGLDKTIYDVESGRDITPCKNPQTDLFWLFFDLCQSLR